MRVYNALWLSGRPRREKQLWPFSGSFSEPTVRSKNMQSPGVRDSTREPILHPFLYCCFACGSRRKAQRETPWTSRNRIILIQENWEGCGQKGLFSQLFVGPPGAVCQSRPIFKTTASV